MRTANRYEFYGCASPARQNEEETGTAALIRACRCPFCGRLFRWEERAAPRQPARSPEAMISQSMIFIGFGGKSAEEIIEESKQWASGPARI